MTPSEEIKWLHSCRKSAQEIVDKITERINELQEKINEKSSIEIPEVSKEQRATKY